MRFSLFTTSVLSAIAAASSLHDYPEDREEFANYMLNQIEEGTMDDDEIVSLAQLYDDTHEGSFIELA